MQRPWVRGKWLEQDCVVVTISSLEKGVLNPRRVATYSPAGKEQRQWPSGSGADPEGASTPTQSQRKEWVGVCATSFRRYSQRKPYCGQQHLLLPRPARAVLCAAVAWHCHSVPLARDYPTPLFSYPPWSASFFIDAQIRQQRTKHNKAQHPLSNTAPRGDPCTMYLSHLPRKGRPKVSSPYPQARVVEPRWVFLQSTP